VVIEDIQRAVKAYRKLTKEERRVFEAESRRKPRGGRKKRRLRKMVRLERIPPESKSTAKKASVKRAKRKADDTGGAEILADS
jgi:hypothetical protein